MYVRIARTASAFNFSLSVHIVLMCVANGRNAHKAKIRWSSNALAHHREYREIFIFHYRQHVVADVHACVAYLN